MKEKLKIILLLSILFFFYIYTVNITIVQGWQFFANKEEEVNVTTKTLVVPLGDAIGLKLYTKGVLIVGKGEINGQKHYENSILQEGDIIISIDGEEVKSTNELIEKVNNSDGNDVLVKYIRDGEEKTDTIKPIETDKKEYKIGFWVRDASAGVGTATFYIPTTNQFAVLGHGISDIDTEKLITISSGELVTTQIVSIQKGKKGSPRRNKRFNRRMW